ncbi:methyl-accepting chemotaxis protein [Sphingomonas sp. BE138]|uniref:methyl-accepting chemotaxis protein n=1 Tax=Sphingomonas sp. BE138 TaxID=2817845 RepID=UPI002855A777|nr:methyl-accepting chemotaxis protein [Sphingomonas sp. BE138]MDR6788213.1 methyl-accepting chemotaxis protein [Sphingomonas sp. BE138]
MKPALRLVPPPPAAPAGDVVDADWATDASTLPRDAPLLAAVTLLRAAPDVRMIAIVDDHDRPCGALLERDMRALLFNPFGHALLSNRGLSMGVAGKMLPCATIEIGSPVVAALAAWRAVDAAEGLVLTRGGRFAGIVAQPVLLRIAAEHAGRAHAAERRRAGRIEAAAHRFRTDGEAMARALGDVSGRVDTASRRIADRAATIDARTGEVAAAIGGTTINLQRIGARAQDFAGALGGVEQRMDAAERVTRDAVARTRSERGQIAALGEAADAIASVSALIDTIAQQTAMLALNATIECARAGEAGRGFTAVAGEVKALAAQTRTAAGGIADHVAHIRTATGAVADGHAGIAQAVDAIDELSASVMAAVREQRAAARAIGTDVGAVGAAAVQIEASMGDVLARAHEAGADAGVMRALAGQLGEIAASVDERVAAFLAELDAPGG